MAALNTKTVNYSQLAVATLAVAVVIAIPFFANAYVVGVALTILMWLALTQSWCLLSGLTGYISLGHVVFYGLGSYFVAVTWQIVPLWLSVPVAGLVAAGFAAVVGLPVLRVRGPYFVILTFGLAELVKYSIMAIEAWIGVSSRILFAAPDLNIVFYGMVGLSLAATILLQVVSGSRFGHGLRSLRENEEAAESLGVPVARYKIMAFVLSALIPGMVGGLMATRSTYFAAGQIFDPIISVTVIAMALIGGSDNARGPLLGVLFLAILSELLWANAPLLYMIILGAIMVIFVLVLPDGLLNMRWLKNREKLGPSRQPGVP